MLLPSSYHCEASELPHLHRSEKSLALMCWINLPFVVAGLQVLFKAIIEKKQTQNQKTFLFLWHWVSKSLIQLEISIELLLNDVNFVSPSPKTMNLRAQRVLMNVRVAMRPNFMGGLTWCKWGPPRYQQCQWRPLSKSLFHLSQWIHARLLILIYCVLIV